MAGALALTMFPEGGPLPAGAATAEVVDYLDEYLGWLPSQQRLLIRAMFLLFELDFAIFNHGSANRLDRASEQELTRCLESWETSRFYFRRAAFQGLKGTLLIAFLRHPTVREQIGIQSGERVMRSPGAFRRATRPPGDTAGRQNPNRES